MDEYPKLFAMDVDGVLTDGRFLWDGTGKKAYKQFGPDDSDALKILGKTIPSLKVVFFTQDREGYLITLTRLKHMGYDLSNILCLSSEDRYSYIEKNWGLENSIYMGDSFMDVPLLRDCRWSCTPSDSSIYARQYASKVLESHGGGRAVAEAVMWVMRDIFGLHEVELYGGMKLPLDIPHDIQ